MSKQRFAIFTTIGCIGFFLVLAMASVQTAGQSANTPGNQPQPVAAPRAIVAPAKSTPTPASDNTQPLGQPVPLPVPTPTGVSEEFAPPSTPALLQILLLGLLTGSTVVLLLGFAIRLGWRRSTNGRSTYRGILTEGGPA